MPAAVRTHPCRPVDDVRVTGVLAADAQLVSSTGREAHRFLIVDLQPPAQGFGFHAQVDLGTDAHDHRAAEALLPQLRTGAVVSVGGTELRLRTDHGHAVLAVLGARNVLLLQDPVPATADAAAPDLFGGGTVTAHPSTHPMP